MTLRIDHAPDSVDREVKAGLASRFSTLRLMGLQEPIVISRPIMLCSFDVPSEGPPVFVLQAARRWEYFVTGTDGIALASVRQTGRRCDFGGITGNETARAILAAVILADAKLGTQRRSFRARLYECRAARLLSLVLEPRSGSAVFANIIDNHRIAPQDLALVTGLETLREVAKARLDEADRTAPLAGKLL